MRLERVRYSELNPKQKEIHNFQKVAALLADFGFNCIKLADDWQGADFLAYHKDHKDTLRVQLKSRLTIDKKYIGKHLFEVFPVKNSWCLIEHDELVSLVGRHAASYMRSKSWMDDGLYHTNAPNDGLLEGLRQYTLNDLE